MQEIIDCGCDYIRFTANLQKDGWKALREVGKALQEDGIARGDESKEFKWRQFVGVAVGSCSWALSSTHAMLTVAGHGAKLAADQIKAGDIDGRCTRLDLQSTVDYGETETNISTRLEKSIRAFEEMQGVGRTCEFHKFSSRSIDTGFTAYSRSSTRYVRFYHAASGGHRELNNHVYRAEVEFKKARAPLMWEMYRAASSGEVLAQSIVTGELLALGINEPWFRGVVPLRAAVVPDSRSDEKTLKWLREQVMPAVNRMIEKGHTAEIDAMWHLMRQGQKAPRSLSASLERQALREKYFPGKKAGYVIHSQSNEVGGR